MAKLDLSAPWQHLSGGQEETGRRGFRHWRSTALATVGVFSLLAVSCFGGGSSSKTLQAYNSSVSSDMNPLNNVELSGYRPLNQIFSMLVTIDEQDKVINDAAESIESTDNKTWTIKIRPGQKFSNGDPVNADSFVKSWNYASTKANGMKGRSFYEVVEGYEEDGDHTSLSGLKTVDDMTFTVTLKDPNNTFRQMLAYKAFAPTPASAYADIKAYGQKPAGNGPYKLAKWTPGVEMVLEKNPEYTGPRVAKNEGIHFKIYNNPVAGYNDLIAGNLDIMDTIPSEQLGAYKNDLSGRNSDRTIAGSWYVVIPFDAPGFAFDNEGRLRRAAISRAIDRQAISDNIFKGTRKPAKEFTSPAVPGYSATIPGHEVLSFDAAEAKKLWEQANAIKPWAGGTLTINYATDRGDKETFEALAHQISNALGIQAEPAANPNWGANLETGQTKKQPFRMSWNADWPADNTFLRTLFYSNANSNYSGYKNPAYDALIRQAEEATSQEASNTAYQKAQEILFKDMPIIPLVYASGLLGWSEALANKPINDFLGIPYYHLIEKK